VGYKTRKPWISRAGKSKDIIPDKVVKDFWGVERKLAHILRDAREFMDARLRFGQITEKEHGRLRDRINKISLSNTEKAILDLDKATYDYKWEHSSHPGFIKARLPAHVENKGANKNRGALLSLLKRAVKRAEDAGINDSEAHRLNKLWKSDPYFILDGKNIDDLLELKMRGSGVETTGSRATFRYTEEAGDVPREITDFRKRVKSINSRIGDLVATGNINLDEASNLRLSSGHGLVKAESAWPQLRNTPSNVFLHPYNLNTSGGSAISQTDIHEYIRMNERMSRDGKKVGASKEGMAQLYKINDLLGKNNLAPIDQSELDYFRGLPNLRSWKSGRLGPVINRIGRPIADVSSMVERSVSNLFDNPTGEMIAKYAPKVGRKMLSLVPGFGTPFQYQASKEYLNDPSLSDIAKKGKAASVWAGLPGLIGEFAIDWDKAKERYDQSLFDTELDRKYGMKKRREMRENIWT